MNTYSIYKKNFKINSINVNSNKRLGLYGLLGFLQDAASEHAEELGFGFDDMMEKGILWVLIRQRLKMEQWPKLHDEITIQTWPKQIKGMYAFREFEIFIDDAKIGECSTTWMILDEKKRRPINAEKINELIIPRMDYSLGFVADKVIVPEEFDFSKSFEVRNSDIDMNNHVNNTKYAQWILDSIPFQYHKSRVVKEFEINFTAETTLGETISCHNTMDVEKSEMIFKGVRESDDKMVFAARLFGKEIN